MKKISSMKLEKKYLILIVRRHSGEIDWILPLIYKMMNNIELITIFSDEKSFESLNKNKIIYKLWKKKCNKFYIIKKYDKFFFKIILKLFQFFKLNKLKFFVELEKYIINKTFDINKLIEKLKINKNEIKLILTPIINLHSLPLILKNNIPGVKLIRFPESQWLNTIDFIKIKKLSRRIYCDKFTDFYLIAKAQNINFFLGDKLKSEIKRKIIFCNFLKYEKWWINKIKISNKIDKKLVTIFTRPPDNITLSVESYKHYIKSIINVLKKIINVKIVFKIHPNLSETELLKRTMKNFKNIDWRIDANHPMTIASKSNFCISMLTSACLDCLAVNKKVIEFFDYSREINKVGAIFSKTKKKWMSIYSKKNLVISVENEIQLNLAINNIFLNKAESLFRLNIRQFKNLISEGLNSKSVSRKIIKSIKSN